MPTAALEDKSEGAVCHSVSLQFYRVGFAQLVYSFDRNETWWPTCNYDVQKHGLLHRQLHTYVFPGAVW